MQIYKLIVTFIMAFALFCQVAGNEFHKFSAKCMGTDFSIIIDHDNKVLCSNAADAAFEEAARLNNIFSDYIADSELSLLSQSSYTGNKVKLSDELFEVQDTANHWLEKQIKLLIQPLGNYPGYGEYPVSEKVCRQKNLCFMH